ncbi:hypothetical protein EDD21DRAFT_368038 [Dissophora ornata]|nr:hypothetical protein EDD21DRAFT_368038 [Dissophora ornata]
MAVSGYRPSKRRVLFLILLRTSQGGDLDHFYYLALIKRMKRARSAALAACCSDFCLITETLHKAAEEHRRRTIRAWSDLSRKF